MNCPKKVEIKYHYEKYDKNCRSDFHNAEIYFDGKVVLALDDEYHDKTSAQFQGFILACQKIWGEQFPKINRSDKNDSKL